MPYQLSIYVVVLAISSLGTIFLALFMWRRRLVPGAADFSLSMFALAAWSISVISTHLSPSLQGKTIWTNVQFLGITLAPLAWLLFVLRYTGKGDKVSPSTLALLSIHPVLTQVVVWTNPYHGLFRRDAWLDASGPIQTLGVTYGPAFWIHAVYTYTLLIVATYFLVRSQLFGARVYRRQGALMLVAIITPWVANFVTITGFVPLSYLDLTPFAFTISAAAIVWGLMRHNLLDLAPAAREAVMESMTTGLVVLDYRDRIVDLNPAAQAMLALPSEIALGKQLSGVFPQYAYMISRSRGAGSVRDEIAIGEGASQRTYDLRVSPLRDARSEVIGHLVSLQDVTKRKLAEIALSRYAERLRILYEIDQAILSAKSPDTVAMAALSQIHHLIPAARMSIVSLDPIEGPRVLAGRGGRRLDAERAPWATPDALRTLRSFEIRCHNQILTGSEASEFDRSLHIEGVRSYMTVPLVAHGALVGTLNLENTVPHAFTADHIDVASQVAASLAVAMENARLYASAQQELTERKLAEAALRQSEIILREKAEDLEQRNAELDAFSHTVAHDLKAPLSLLMGYASFLNAHDVERRPEDLEVSIDAVGHAARKMSSIIDELLLLASVRKMDDIELMPLDTEAIVYAVRQRLADLIEEYGAVVTEPDVWPIARGYAPWVEEVWVNYISNAIKYGGTPPEVELGATPIRSDSGENSVIRFWVRDNGNGLSREQRERLFIPFERLEQVRAKGYGLGLSIVQRIMDKLGGDSGVASTGKPGEGSYFYFELQEADL